MGRASAARCQTGISWAEDDVDGEQQEEEGGEGGPFWRDLDFRASVVMVR